jgi:hypothetical protein
VFHVVLLGVVYVELEGGEHGAVEGNVRKVAENWGVVDESIKYGVGRRITVI